MLTFAATAAIFLAAGFTQGLTGFGAGLVAMPLLVLAHDIKVAVPLSMLNGLVITSFLSWRHRRDVDPRKVLPLLMGCLPGIGLGLLFLARTESRVLQILMGSLIVLYGLFSLNRRPRPRQMAAFWPFLAGFATGIISALFSAGGPPTIIYASLTNWRKDEIKATLSAFFFTSGVITALGHLASGLTTGRVTGLLAATVPAVLAGVFLGARCYDTLHTEQYLRVIFIGLIGLGLLMIGSALF